MTTFQKIIKYCAIAFAIFLIVSIVSGGLTMVGFILNFNNKGISDKMETYAVNGNVHSIDLEIDAADVEIIGETVSSDKFNIESNIKDLKVENNDGVLKIKSKNNKFVKNSNFVLKIHIPSFIYFEKLDFTIGAGKIDMPRVKTKDLNLETGAGSANLENVTVENKAKIEGGAGQINIINSDFKNVEADIGVGKLVYNGTLSGNSDFECGVGSIELSLNNKSSYTFIADKGLGDIYVEGKSLSDGETYGNGEHIVKLSNGVGSIRVGFSIVLG